MRRVKLIVAYDGTNYCGWQIQDNGISVESVLNRRLSELLREKIAVMGASRTDSGVHALGNVAVFDTEARLPPEKMSHALNQRLPEDIRIQHSCEVPLNFHPRFQKTIKTYEYRILHRTFELPLYRLDTHFVYWKLNFDKMKEAAAYFAGEHDFKSFSNIRSKSPSTVRTIYEISLSREDDIITVRITGNSFLYNMVRIMVGTLLKVGEGRYEPEHIKEILQKGDREAAGPTVPARGLTLLEIRYPQYEEQLSVQSTE